MKRCAHNYFSFAFAVDDVAAFPKPVPVLLGLCPLVSAEMYVSARVTIVVTEKEPNLLSMTRHARFYVMSGLM